MILETRFYEAEGSEQNLKIYRLIEHASESQLSKHGFYAREEFIMLDHIGAGGVLVCNHKLDDRGGSRVIVYEEATPLVQVTEINPDSIHVAVDSLERFLCSQGENIKLKDVTRRCIL